MKKIYFKTIYRGEISDAETIDEMPSFSQAKSVMLNNASVFIRIWYEISKSKWHSITLTSKKLTPQKIILLYYSK